MEGHRAKYVQERECQFYTVGNLVHRQFAFAFKRGKNKIRYEDI